MLRSTLYAWVDRLERCATMGGDHIKDRGQCMAELVLIALTPFDGHNQVGHSAEPAFEKSTSRSRPTNGEGH
jgi:hypothetical protein